MTRRINISTSFFQTHTECSTFCSGFSCSVLKELRPASLNIRMGCSRRTPGGPEPPPHTRNVQCRKFQINILFTCQFFTCCSLAPSGVACPLDQNLGNYFLESAGGNGLSWSFCETSGKGNFYFGGLLDKHNDCQVYLMQSLCHCGNHPEGQGPAVCVAQH